jgi:hypothetical protein
MRVRRSPLLALVAVSAFALTACPDDEPEVTADPEATQADFCQVATTDVGVFDFAGNRELTDAIGAMRRIQPVTPDEIRDDVDTIAETFEQVAAALPPEEPSLDVQGALVTASALTEIDQEALARAVDNVDAYVQEHCLDEVPGDDAPSPPGQP